MKTAQQRPCARASGGFTLLEAMIALAVLATGLLTLAVMQLQALTQGSAGRHTADAAAVARTYLEQMQRLPWTELDTAEAAGTWTNPAWAGAAANVDTTLEIPGGGGGTSVEHSYGVQWRVTNVMVSGLPNPCLRNVEVRVSWDEEKRSTPKTLDLITRRYNWGDSSC